MRQIPAMMRFHFVVWAGLVAGTVLGSGCGGSIGTPPSASLPIVHTFDAAAAERGKTLLTVNTVSEGYIPRAGIESLWLVWPDGYSGDYWAAFRARYGLFEAPFANDGLPMGIRAVGDKVTFDCLLCHGSKVAGQLMIGVANSMLDVQGLIDDMTAAGKLAGIVPPYKLTNRTGAAGATDAVGMGFAFGQKIYGAAAANLRTDVGFERAPAWWQLKHKKWAFNDGSAVAPSFRTMAGTLLAFGLTIDQISQRAPEFEDIGNYILSLEAPKWPLGQLDLSKWAQGRAVFETSCSSCHGVYHGDHPSYPDQIVPVAQIGTDPDRTMLFGPNEINAINSTWFGDPPMIDTDGYLAPTLLGIWARAPYFHNGSVPDLAGALESSARPALWRRTGSEAADYDKDKVGWRYEVPTDHGDPSTIAGRKIYDTAREGLGNGGHKYGDSLSESDRTAVIEYLKSL